MNTFKICHMPGKNVEKEIPHEGYTYREAIHDHMGTTDLVGYCVSIGRRQCFLRMLDRPITPNAQIVLYHQTVGD